EEAGDAPVGQLGELLLVGAQALDARQLFSGTELAPADADFAIIDEGGVRAALTNALLFRRPVLRRRSAPSDALGMERHAPATAPYAVVPFDQLGKVGPCGRVERLNGVARHHRHTVSACRSAVKGESRP